MNCIYLFSSLNKSLQIYKSNTISLVILLLPYAAYHLKTLFLRCPISAPGDASLHDVNFTSALHDHKPLSLCGVSLNVPDATVAWNDIGGLRQVKDTLLEVIEWPTKVSKLNGVYQINVLRNQLSCARTNCPSLRSYLS